MEERKEGKEGRNKGMERERMRGGGQNERRKLKLEKKDRCLFILFSNSDNTQAFDPKNNALLHIQKSHPCSPDCSLGLNQIDSLENLHVGEVSQSSFSFY